MEPGIAQVALLDGYTEQVGSRAGSGHELMFGSLRQRRSVPTPPPSPTIVDATRAQMATLAAVTTLHKELPRPRASPGREQAVLRGDQADVPEAETRLRSQCEALDRCRGGITARCPWLRGDQVHQDRRHTAGENAEGASEIAEGRNSEERDFHWGLLRKRPLRAGESFARSLGPHTAAPLARSVRLRRLSSRSSTLSPRAIGPYV